MNDPTTACLLNRACDGDSGAFAELFGQHRERLKRLVSLRLDQRIRRRLDDSDVIQEAFLDAAKRLADYVKNPQIEFYLWLRLTTLQSLGQLHRKHLEAQRRDARRELPASRTGTLQARTLCLAEGLVDQITSVVSRASRQEMQAKLEKVLVELDEHDREVLALKHFEEMTNAEIGQIMGVTESGASKRYIRALRRLQQKAKAAGLIGADM